MNEQFVLFDSHLAYLAHLESLSVCLCAAGPCQPTRRRSLSPSVRVKANLLTWEKQWDVCRRHARTTRINVSGLRRDDIDFQRLHSLHEAEAGEES